MPGMPAGFASGPPPGGSISPSQLASQAAYTVLGNNTAGTASPTAVAPSAWPATTSAAGFMSAADKTKTDRYSYGAGSPEGVVTATVGCTYQDTTNGWIWQKLSGTGNTGWKVTGYSGTYTPTGTIVTNLDSVTPGIFSYLRVGDCVFVSGVVASDPTASGLTVFGLSLPIASAFSASYQANGSGVAVPGFVAYIVADATNDRVEVTVPLNTSTTSYNTRIIFAYTVI